jgi:multicomponent Na+:H+ antiporter MnhC subunit
LRHTGRLVFPQVAHGNVLRQEIEWLPALGLNLVFRMDGFAWLFCMLVLGIGALVVLYARYYMSASDPVPRFFSFFLAFMGAMMGVVLSGNLVQMVLFWELTSLFSFLLIGYWHHRRDARRGARMALTVTGAGGLCLLAGVLVLGRIVGSYELDVVLASGDLIRAHALYPVVLVLVLLGAFTKSAQFPFHFWLPRAMAAPTPVSAYLHSATMVKLGVFLMARLWPVLSGTEQWFWLVGGAGAITLLLGGFAAMFQRDLKALLAYSTISHLGLITLLLGLNSPLAAVAAVFHVMNHATFKASLFMAAGIIDHETGTRDIRKLSGLMRLMPITGTLAIIASASMAGVPLLNGFLSKEMFFAETVFIQATPWIDFSLPVIATIAGIFSVAYSARFVFDVFFGPPCGNDVPKHPHEPPHWMRVPVELLVLVCLVVGVAPAWSIGPLLAAAATPVVGGTLPEYSLAVWHGFNLPLVMSFVALVGGGVLYLLQRRQRAQGRLEHTPLLHRFDGQAIFEHLLALLSEAGRRSRRLFGTRRMQWQLLLLVLVAVAGAAASLWATPAAPGTRELLPFSPMFAMTWIIGGTCALAAAWQAKFHRLAALMLASGAGLVSCVTYIWFSAPDLALTQLVVEAVTTVLILLGLRWLPMRSKDVIQPRARAAAPLGPARSRLAGGRPGWHRHGDAGLGHDDAHLPAEHLALLPRARAHRRRRHQRGQRDAGRLPRLRHLRRDHRAGHRGAHRVCAVAALSPGHRIDGAAGAAAPAGRRRQQRPAEPAPRQGHRRGLPDGAGRAGAPAAAAGGAGVGVLLHARAQRAGRRLRRRAGDVGRAGAAVHRLGHRVGGRAPAHLPAPLDRHRPAAGAVHGRRRGGVRLPLPHHAHRAPAPARAGRGACAQRPLLRHRRVRAGARRHHADPYRPGPPIGAQPPLGRRTGRERSPGRGRSRGGSALMEIVLALAIGVLTGSGVYMLLRPRTFQVIMGLTLISYAVNLFIFSMGRLKVDSEPVLIKGFEATLANTADPMPQALVLTAIVIGFAMTALFLVVMLASRGLTGTDHVDGEERQEAE